ncbi:hypothetical protein, partial [Rhodoplanes sp. SY1]|uniref:hypothetical protein n=1 Tax=Rhodoplanes sp. SY1 TaxID=3166646 RepID=UPI0038B4FB9E
SFGTLSYFFKRPHIFSRRDIDLFKGFCKRVSDALFIAQTFSEMHAQAAILEAQASRMTYVEVTSLLAHDLWHKSFNSWVAAEENDDLIKRFIKAERLRSSPAVLENIVASTESTLQAAEEVHSTSSNLRSLQVKPADQSYKPELFDALDVIKSVERTLRPALSRQKIAFKISSNGTFNV